jgi:hypothetical protein
MAIFGWGGRRRRPEADDRSTATERDAGPSDAVIDAAVRVALLPGFRTLRQVADAVAWDLEAAASRLDRDGTTTAALDSAVLHARVLERAGALRRELAPTPGDGYERLSDAFRTAAEHGMLALMGVGVDVRGARDEVDRLFAEDPRPWAFVCFSQQDADALADPPADLQLTFGALRPDPSIDPDLVAAAGETGHAAAAIRERSTLAAGAIVLEALADNGLDAGWDGEIGQPIVVHLLDWGKPLPE